MTHVTKVTNGELEEILNFKHSIKFGIVRDAEVFKLFWKYSSCIYLIFQQKNNKKLKNDCLFNSCYSRQSNNSKKSDIFGQVRSDYLKINNLNF